VKNEELKQEVYRYWNKASCGTEYTKQQKFSDAYFEEIEQFRYTVEPEIFSFSQFTRAHGKKLLEVGVGAGTDFLQWVRAGAIAYGIDLTDEAIANTTHRLSLHGLKAQELRVADGQTLPYTDNFFDIVYSWGVIHHAPDMAACLKEIIRVTNHGGTIKIMIYNRYSLFALYRWIIAALGRGRPFRSLSHVLFYDQESKGTKAYTFNEFKKMVEHLPVTIVTMQATVSKHDLLYYKSKPFRLAAYIAASLGGWHRVGWFMTIELKKQS
jgi:SAM-dependent methyltransferase